MVGPQTTHTGPVTSRNLRFSSYPVAVRPPGRVRRAGAAGARPGVVIDALQGRASRLGGLLRAQHAEVGLCLAAAAGLSPSRLCARHGEVRRQKARKMCVCGRVMGLGS